MDVLIYAGAAGDRNPRGVEGAARIGARLAEMLEVPVDVVGARAPLVEGGWLAQLQAAIPDLRRLQEELARRLSAGERTVVAMGRCAAGLATLPPVAQRYPDAAIVWFDAHGDCNTPGGGPGAEAGYLGGMVLTGAAGEWRTGLGAGLDLSNVILVGARDLDPPEQRRIDSGQIRLVGVGADLPGRLRAALAGRSAYVHLDCDVVNAGLLATEYQCADGLTYGDLSEAFDVLAEHDVIGLEIAEYEGVWRDGRESPPDELLAAIWPAVDLLARDRFGPLRPMNCILRQD